MQEGHPEDGASLAMCRYITPPSQEDRWMCCRCQAPLSLVHTIVNGARSSAGGLSFAPTEPTRVPVTTAVLPKRWTFTSSARRSITASELNSASNLAGFRT